MPLVKQNRRPGLGVCCRKEQEQNAEDQDGYSWKTGHGSSFIAMIPAVIKADKQDVLYL
jgi:hypothetical protein